MSDALLAANRRFYEAFSRADLGAMDDVWARVVPVTCVHPGWTPLVEREEIMESWQAILAGSAPREIEYGAAEAFPGEVTIENLPNPRVELEQHYYNVTHSGLVELGLTPHLLSDTLITSLFDIAKRYRERVDLPARVAADYERLQGQEVLDVDQAHRAQPGPRLGVHADEAAPALLAAARRGLPVDH